VLTVPKGFVVDLEGMVRSPTLQVELAPGGLRPRLEQQVQALVYSLNRKLQRTYVEQNLQYVQLLLHGGSGTFLGQKFEVLGLDGSQRVLAGLPRGSRLDQLREFVREAKLALAQTDDALRATANPIDLKRINDRGRSWLLGAQVQAYALAITLTFLALVLAAGALAAERDENVIGRLARGLVRLLDLIMVKVALAGLVALGLGLTIALVFGALAEVFDVSGGEPWQRLPLLVLGLALAGAAFGAFGALVGTLARESRTAVLVAFLAALPLVLVGLVPSGSVDATGWVSAAFPFKHSVHFFQAALYDLDPWGTLAREAAWLAGLAVVFAAAARLGVRRLLS
jgi:ABC-2 type transport system permease protein